MKNDEIMKLKKFYITKNNLSKKPKISYFQKKILFLISLFVICFLIYKILYLIYSMVYSNKGINKKIGKIIVKNVINNEVINDKIKINEEDSNKKVYLSNLTISFSYSEHLEDLILNVFFYEIHYGFYIDIGDFTPSKYSVTKHFYLKGWSGINIRPIKEEYLELAKERYRDINLNYYIGGAIDINYIHQNYSINISGILQEYIPKNQEIHFCRIHTLGDEKNILLDYNFENYRPKIFCIESEKLRPNYQNFEYILINNEYSFGYQYKNVRYYIDNNEKKISLKDRINYLNEVIQEYNNKKM